MVLPAVNPDEHARMLLAQMHTLYKQRVLCDFALVVSGSQEIHVHKTMLVAFAKVFKAMLDSNMLIGQSYLVTDIDPECTQRLVDFMYTGTLNLSRDTWVDIRQAASSWGMQAAVDLCDKFMEEVLMHGSPKQKYLKLKEELEDPDYECEELALETPEEPPKRRKRGRPKKGESVIRVKASPVAPVDGTVKKGRGRPRKKTVDPVVKVDKDQIKAFAAFPKNGGTRTRKGQGRKRSKTAKGRSEKKKDAEELLSDPEDADWEAAIFGSLDGFPSEDLEGAECPTVDVQEKLCHFGCKFCTKKFLHFSACQLHSKKHWRRPFRVNMPNWRDHLLTSLMAKVGRGKQSPVYRCAQCGKDFRYRGALQRHLVVRHVKLIRCRTCCRRVFKSWSLLATHRFCKHRTSKARRGALVRCNVCDRAFLHSANMERHRKLVHPVVYMCTHCSRGYDTKSKYLIHMKTHLPQDIIGMEPQKRPSKAKVTRVRGAKSSNGNQAPRHRRAEDGVAAYSCQICLQDFHSSDGVHLHMRMVHKLGSLPSKKRGQKLSRADALSKKWSCHECQLQRSSRVQLEDHMKGCHGDLIYTCSRESCTYQTRIKQGLDKHCRQKHSNNPRKICEHCAKEFSKRRLLKIHQYRAHQYLDPSIRIYKCNYEGCRYLCFDSAILAIHEIKHKDDKPYQCPHCDRTFKRQHVMNNHVKTVHLKVKPFICDQCGKAYPFQAQLRMHMAHHGEGQAELFKCEQCSYISESKGNYQSHMWSKHRERIHEHQQVFSCEKCGYSSDRKTRFREHMMSHGPDILTCQHCGKGFKTRRTLETHVLWKHTEKNLHCDYCNFKASVINHLREHVRMMHTHRNVKPFKCAYCDYCAATSGNCRKHVMARHKGNEVKWVKVCDKYPGNTKPMLTAEVSLRKSRMLPGGLTENLQGANPILPPSPPPQQQQQQQQQQQAFHTPTEVPSSNIQSTPLIIPQVARPAPELMEVSSMQNTPPMPLAVPPQMSNMAAMYHNQVDPNSQAIQAAQVLHSMQMNMPADPNQVYSLTPDHMQAMQHYYGKY